MSAKNASPLDRIRIASPCSARWEEMEGSDARRFCRLCSKNVYNFSALSSDQVISLVQQHEGKICARFYQRTDGTMMTQDCPAAIERVRERVRVYLGATVALMGISFAALAATLPSGEGRSNRLKNKVAAWTDRACQALGIPRPGVVMGTMAAPLMGDIYIPTTNQPPTQPVSE